MIDGNARIGKIIAVNIRAERLRRGMTRAKLAKAAAIAESGLYKIENDISNPNVNTLARIANVLGIPVYTLVIEHSERDYSELRDLRIRS